MDRPAALPIRATPLGKPTRPVTVVTGGSEGIGLAIAGRFAARGHSLVLIARQMEPLEAAAKMLRARHGGEVTTLRVDLTDIGVLDALDALYPGVKARLCLEGELRPGMAVAVDGNMSSLGLRQKVQPTSEVHFLPAIGGG